jgi:hypothetical protein
MQSKFQRSDWKKETNTVPESGSHVAGRNMTSIKAMATDPIKIRHLFRLKRQRAWSILAFDIVASLGIGQRRF